MRLMILSKHFHGIINNLIHRGFLNAFPGEVFWYGPGEDICPEAESLRDAVKRLSPDFVLVNMKKRVDWLSLEDIASITVPKAVLEVDFCYEKSDQWYRDCGFDRVFFRSYCDATNSTLPGARWMPFSVHESWICEPTKTERRAKKVTYIGNRSRPEIYPVRNLAVSILKRAHMFDEPVRPQYDVDYMRWWRRYLIGLTCGSKFNQTNAKHLIIPAAGAALLTDGPPGTELLFPDQSSYWRYKRDGSDLEDVVRSILGDRTMVLGARKRMCEIVRERHTHAARWAELLASM